MIFVLVLLLALFVIPSPWSIVAVFVGAVWELATIGGGIWWSQRKRAQTGAEALVGREARVIERCDPFGKVAVRGEIWNAKCEDGAEVDDLVHVRGLDGLTVLVEREPASP
ncbi:MAG TPA: NfeD family protein [Gaiellaceae bacterium]|nr:NfeD family protein [Gaiellaceae bacterium]